MIWVQESFVNQTEGYRFGDDEVYETYTDDKAKLFKTMQRKYGRCTGRIYIDREEEPKTISVGWVFEKTMEYEDARANWPKERREYVREVWVTLHAGPPTRPPVVYNYLYPASKTPAAVRG